MKIVVINCLKQYRIRVYYFYGKDLIKSGNYRIGKFDVNHHRMMYNIINKNIIRITDDEVYRIHCFEKNDAISKKRERH